MLLIDDVTASGFPVNSICGEGYYAVMMPHYVVLPNCGTSTL